MWGFGNPIAAKELRRKIGDGFEGCELDNEIDLVVELLGAGVRRSPCSRQYARGRRTRA